MSQSSRPLLESSPENRASILTANSLNTSWNLSLFIASVVILSISTKELPNTPLRAWVIVFAVIHFVDALLILAIQCVREVIVKILQGVSQVFAFVWWIIGVVWLLTGSHALRENAPILYWATVVFLAFRLLVIVLICVAMPLCFCCLPFFLALFSSDPNQEGALETNRSVDLEAPILPTEETNTVTVETPKAEAST
ncbi:hypothetical protein ACHQM5_018208 [Ranunculus cassubicifolius]